MCSPDFSFNVTKGGKVLTSMGEQSHSTLSDKYKIDDDKVLKVSYDWKIRDYEFDEKPFTPKSSHIKRIEETIANHFGDWKKAMSSLVSIARKDIGVFRELESVLKGKGKKEWYRYTKPINNCDITKEEDAPVIILRKFIELFSIKENRATAWSG